MASLLSKGSSFSKKSSTQTYRQSFQSPGLSKRFVTIDLSKKRSAGGLVATVFGATGFTGRYVVNRLARSGAQIIIPFRGEEKSWDHLKVTGEVGQIIPLRYDIRDKGLIEKAVSHSQIVINLLGARYETRNFSFEDVHIEATRHIAEASSKYGVQRVIHFSTVNADKNSPSKWARTKAEGDELLRSIVPHTTIIKPTIIFGTEDRLLNHFARITTQFFPLFLYKEDAKLQPVYVRDVASAVMAVLGDENTTGKEFEIGGPHTYTYGDFGDFMVEITKRTSKGLFVIPERLAWLRSKLAETLYEQRRNPYYTKDQVIFYNHKDLVVNPETLGLNFLKITPTPLLEAPLAFLQMYHHQ